MSGWEDREKCSNKHLKQSISPTMSIGSKELVFVCSKLVYLLLLGPSTINILPIANPIAGFLG